MTLYRTAWGDLIPDLDNMGDGVEFDYTNGDCDELAEDNKVPHDEARNGPQVSSILNLVSIMHLLRKSDYGN